MKKFYKNVNWSNKLLPCNLHVSVILAWAFWLQKFTYTFRLIWYYENHNFLFTQILISLIYTYDSVADSATFLFGFVLLNYCRTAVEIIAVVCDCWFDEQVFLCQLLISRFTHDISIICTIGRFLDLSISISQYLT